MSKLSEKLMDHLIFQKEISDEDVVMGPSYGEDAAVVKIGEKYLIAHSDPISGAVENIGWLAVNIAANDIAVCGAAPRWMLPTVQVPKGYSEESIVEIFTDLYKGTSELQIDIIGGHSEIVDSIEQPLVNSTMMGITDSPIYTKDAASGDKIVQIDKAGIEGSWILSMDYREELIERGVDERTIEKAVSLKKDISVVENALSVKDKVNSMHDPTEGGILQGLYEMARASNKRFILDTEPKVGETTIRISDALDIDPLKLISSGCLLVTVPENADIEKGKVIGRVEDGEASLLYNEKKIESIHEDELFKAIRNLD